MDAAINSLLEKLNSLVSVARLIAVVLSGIIDAHPLINNPNERVSSKYRFILINI
jgi:hypothetical protein